MTEEKYQMFVKSLTSTTLDGFNNAEVYEAFSILTRANMMEHALIRAVMTLNAAKSDCGRCTGCTKKVEHFCPVILRDKIKGALGMEEDKDDGK